MKWLYLVAIIFLVSNLTEARKLKIAVVGGGIGGTTCSYFLSQYFGDDVEIDLFEKEEKLGGRLNVANVGGRLYESGGSIIHPKNRIVDFLRQKFGLRKRAEGPSDIMGIFNGEKFDFVSSKWSAVTLVKLFLRYGFDMLRSSKLVKDMLSKFEKIYDLQKNGYAFTRVESLLSAMSPEFVELLDKTAAAHFKKKGLSDKFVQELSQAAALANYGQSMEDLHGFVASVSMAGAEGGLYSISGGNYLLAEGAFNHSGATLHSCAVQSVTMQQNGKMTIQCAVDMSTGARSKMEGTFMDYDYAILAVPMISGQRPIGLEGFSPGAIKHPLAELMGQYHQTVATLVQGQVAPEAFHFELSGDLPDEILLSNASLFYKSMGRITPVDLDKSEPPVESRRKRVHKVFSSGPLSNQQTDYLFRSVLAQKSVVWRAYPDYRQIRNFHDLPFVVADNVYYLNSIEWAASAMEMSAISGRNIALLIQNKENGSWDKIDAAKSIERQMKSDL